MRVVIDPHRLELAPGTSATIQVRVTNTGDVIDRFRVAPLGLESRFLTAQPAEGLSLFPGESGDLIVTLTVPEDRPAAGAVAASGEHHRVGLAVSSEHDLGEIEVAELDLHVVPTPGLAIEPSPDMVTTGRWAEFALLISNTGNSDRLLDLAARDAEDRLQVTVWPHRVDVPAGGRADAFLTATGPRPLFGTPIPHLITIAASDAGSPDNALEQVVTLIQRPWIPRMALLLLGLTAFFGVWAVLIAAGLDDVSDAVDDRIDGVELDLTDVEEQAEADLEAATGDPDAGSIEGRVVAASNGTPVAGADVVVVLRAAPPTTDDTTLGPQPGDELGEAATDDTGAFTVENLPAGDYEVSVVADGYQSDPAALHQVTVEARLASNLDVALNGEPGSVAGSVAESAGGEVVIPAGGATARLFPAAADLDGAPVAQATVAENGIFTILDVETPAAYELVVDKGEAGTYRRAVVPVALQPGEQVVLDQILIEPGDGTLAGAVLGADGAPLGGASIELSTSGGVVAFQTRTPTEGDGLGTFRLSGLPTPETYTLRATAPGFGAAATVITLGIAQTLEGQNLTLLPAIGSITGTVSTPDPAGDGSALVPLGRVRVTVSGPPTAGADASSPIVTFTLTADEPTAALGSFRIDGLVVPGTYLLTYELAGFATVVSDPVTLTPEAPIATQAVTLKPTTGGANGSVVDRLGQAVVDTPVRVSGATNPALGGTVRTVSQPPGQFVVAGLDAGPYVFEISDAASGFVTQRRTVDIVAGGIVPLGTIVVESVDSVQVFDQTESADHLVVRGLDGAVLEEVPYEGGVAAFAGLPHGSLVTFEAFTANDALMARAAVVLEAEMSFPAFEVPD